MNLVEERHARFPLQCFSYGIARRFPGRLDADLDAETAVTELTTRFRHDLTVHGEPAADVLGAGEVGTCVLWYMLGVAYRAGMDDERAGGEG